MIPEWKNRLLFPWRRSRFERDMDEEIRFHLESRVEELVESGMSEREARLRARREFGPVASAREGSRMAWQVRWLADLATDFRLALRGFRRNPGFTATAVLSLGLGIGATSAVFSMIDAALWRPLAVAEPERLVRLGSQRKLREPSDDLTVKLAKRMAGLPVFSGVLTATADGLSFEYDGRAERVIGEVVSPNYFDLLGVRPFLGQPFTDGTRSGRWAAEAVLSYRFWKTRFGGDPGVVGRTIRLNTYPFTIVGVSPPQFQGLWRGRDYEIQLPQLPEGQTLKEVAILDGSDTWVGVMARLAPGVTAAQAEAAVDARLPELLSGQPVSDSRLIERILVLPGSRGWVETDLRAFRGTLYALLALVGLVLLIACANQTSMLLARAAARHKELAVQCSIGAGRGRLMRQMVTESLALAVLGGLAGLAVAGPAGRLLFTFLPQGHLALTLDIRTEGRVLLFTFALAVATGIAVGLVPALQATRGNLALTMRAHSGGAAARTRGALVALQATFCVAVLAATGALSRGMAELRAPEYGGATARTLLFTMKPQNEIYPPERLARLYDEVVRRVSALPGVSAAGLAENGPLGSRFWENPVSTADGRTADAYADKVTPGFFDLIGLPLLAGRDFALSDGPKSAAVAIVNQSLARALFGNASPIGRAIRMPRGGSYRIVGMVGDMHYATLHGQPRKAVWFAAEQEGLYMPTLFVKPGRSAAGALTARIRQEFDAIDKGFPVFNTRTMEARVDDAMSRERMAADYSVILGALALTMAAVGLYGVLSYAVVRRRREIGIRMALGSDGGAVVWLVARDALRLMAIGAVGGSAAALVLQPLLAQVVAIPPMSAGLLTAAAGVMGIAGLAAAIVPAMRAARTDPLQALRVE